jgi:c(7)-type cytochrome triheme protein
MARSAWLGVLGVLVAVGVAVAAGMPLPPDFAFAKTAKNTLGAVTFSHQKHADAKVTNCMDCHAPGKFQMKKGTSSDMTMDAMNAGKSCGACHNGQKAFSTKDAAGCAKCHKA